jgi:hypothetical protein
VLENVGLENKPRRKRRSREQIAEPVREFESSGLSGNPYSLSKSPAIELDLELQNTMIFEIDKSGEKEPLQMSPSTLSSQGWDEQKFQNYLYNNFAHFVGADLYVISQSRPG